MFLFNDSTKSCLSRSLAAETIEMATLGIMGTVSLIGNILVIAVISRSHRVQWVTNLFVAHLAIVNISVPLLSAPFYFHWSLKRSWALGSTTCKLVYFSHYLNSGVSVCMLTCIALDRYYVVVQPLTLHLRRSQTFQLITFIWVFIIFMSTPSLYFYDLRKTECGMVCSVDNSLSSWGGFFIVFSILGFFSPLCILIFLYTLVVKSIHERDLFTDKQARTFNSLAIAQRGTSEASKSQQKFLGKVPKTKRKVIKMLMIQNVIFVGCWLPYFAKEISKLWSPFEYENNAVYLWLSFSNATINPVLYAFFNSNFRKGCRHLINVNISQPYALNALNRKHQVGTGESSHHGSEDETAERAITLKSTRDADVFAKEPYAGPTEKEIGNSWKEENRKNVVKNFQASSIGSVDAWS